MPYSAKEAEVPLRYLPSYLKGSAALATTLFFRREVLIRTSYCSGNQTSVKSSWIVDSISLTSGEAMSNSCSVLWPLDNSVGSYKIVIRFSNIMKFTAEL